MKKLVSFKAGILLAVITFASFAFHPQTNAEVKPPKWLTGEWQGVGLQLNFPTTWSIELSVVEKQFIILYPSLDCGGEWKLIDCNKHRAIFEERILDGVNKCVQGGTVIITRVDDNHISYSYFSPDSGKLEATSTLINKLAIDTVRS